MTSSWFIPAFLVYLLFGLYIGTIGAAAFGGFRGIQDVFRLPWLGYGLLLGTLQIAHIFSPVDRGFSTGFLLVTWTLAISVQLWRAAQRTAASEGETKAWPGVLSLSAIGLLVFIPVFNTCTKFASHYDLGLYYLQKIRWMETFPIVPGLGNLLLNLGYNQSVFLVTALLDSLLPERVGLWLVGGLLPWLGVTLSAYVLLRLLLARRAQRSSLEVAYVISLPAWIYTLLGNNISSGSPDVTSSCLLIHFFLTFGAFMMTAERQERVRTLGDLWVLGAVCLCVKLNTLGMVIGIFIAALVFLVLEKDLSSCWKSKAVCAAAIAACLVGFWAYRGVLLSGYPLFPSRVLAAPVSWKVRPSTTDRFREDVVHWARIPFGDRKIALDGLSWVKPWMKRIASLDIQFAWPVGIGLVGSVAVLLLAWLEARLRRAGYFLILLCALLLLHTTFWLATAPEPRYFGATPWLFAAAPVLALLAAQQSTAFLSAVANLYLCAVPMAALMVSSAWAWAKPEPRFPEIPRPEMAEHANASGLRYYAPVEGNQSYDHMLPSWSGKLHDIELLDPAAGIGGGFRRLCSAKAPPRP